jgi:hypothetical protein
MNPAQPPMQLQLTQDLLARADALIAAMAADPEVRALGMPTRTAVLRVALACGLRDLERQYQPPAPAHASALHPRTHPHASTHRPLEACSPTSMRGVTARTGRQEGPMAGPVCRPPLRKDRNGHRPIATQYRH